MKIKVIKNKKDYHKAMEHLATLMALDPPIGSVKEDELELLALVIEAYEHQYVPPAHPDPVEAILFRMDQMHLTRKDLIPYLGSESKISEVLNHKRPLSLTMMRRLYQGLGIPAEILLGNVFNDNKHVA